MPSYLVLSLLMLAFWVHSSRGQSPEKAVPPTYPLAAKAAGIDGPVVLSGTIAKDGTLKNLRVVSGPGLLRQAALDAVQHWTYKPYRHFGRLVEVDTTITVNFTMGVGPAKAAEQAKAQAELAQAEAVRSPSATQREK